MPSSGVFRRVEGSKNRRFGGTYRLHHQDEKVKENKRGNGNNGFI
jgi:hypothetical protein